ncbi:sigma-70 family RNA polymerase sigma factor [Nostoc sp. UCD121]|uniref:sigma-70 family RNA polymerase sigma factor n=1 Tax=unclassified Nostoc TaxID=2593658 RepID=UPI000DEC04AB|nr:MULTISPECIES: sigma-70 family RNA polymerase sigma factor [unclassified Nostoc]MBC1294802.1 sigma-70 family RNA polymerase sigma factor [Nostoc sp. UCD122]MBD2506786.1 sigma-70 family RNA polymerase sigma factor [Desmonostoc muscorum FACHB-395]MBC1219652.1 sigma-70 family RNA polymerase sigma factor [Nostoc sp. UCD120]MBC1277500.1 sigma-70 family RNA polymerase sigma factor [Nostoc sp. UCD121]QHG16839.1 sigma-70 family RNA polymerase sigma factor [Nostoc sp. ATCC 53789]
MQIPHFPEANHPLVKSLFHHSDHELLTLFQRHPDAGKYFTVIFCRYSPIVYTLIRHSARSPVQADYLFALTWRHIYYELGGLNLTSPESGEPALTMQNWLINMTAFCINEIKLPPTEAIHYSLQATSPPLWCYVQQALDQLPPVLRLIVLMAQTFHWSETRIAAYLQAEGEAIAPNEVANFLQEGYRMLEDKLPTDIRAIYFGEDLAQS